MKKVLLYHLHGSSETKRKVWEIKGHRNGSGLHPNEGAEVRREVKALYCQAGLDVTGSFYTTDK